MSDSSPWSFSLTREDILARRLKRAQITTEIEDLQRQLIEVDRWLDAVKLIVPAHFLSGIEEAVEGAHEGPERVSVWRQAISEALTQTATGWLPRDIALYIKEHGTIEAKERLIRNPNGLYNALSRMLNEGHVKKHNDKFYRQSLYEHLAANGELDEDADDRGVSGVSAYILDLFKEWDRLLPREIISYLRENEEYRERIEHNPQYGYSAIARLARQGRLEKDGSHYLLPLKKNEPADVSPSSGSDAASVFD